MLTIELKNWLWGYHDEDLGLGPTNFRVTQRKLQAIIYKTEDDLKLVKDIAELDLDADPTKFHVYKDPIGFIKRWAKKNGMTDLRNVKMPAVEYVDRWDRSN